MAAQLSHREPTAVKYATCQWEVNFRFKEENELGIYIQTS